MERCDAVDTEGVWCPALRSAPSSNSSSSSSNNNNSNKRVRLHFVGWEKEWDEELLERVAAERTRPSGSRTAARRAWFVGGKAQPRPVVAFLRSANDEAGAAYLRTERGVLIRRFGTESKEESKQFAFVDAAKLKPWSALRDSFVPGTDSERKALKECLSWSDYVVTEEEFEFEEGTLVRGFSFPDAATTTAHATSASPTPPPPPPRPALGGLEPASSSRRHHHRRDDGDDEDEDNDALQLPPPPPLPPFLTRRPVVVSSSSPSDEQADDIPFPLNTTLFPLPASGAVWTSVLSSVSSPASATTTAALAAQLDKAKDAESAPPNPALHPVAAGSASGTTTSSTSPREAGAKRPRS